MRIEREIVDAIHLASVLVAPQPLHLSGATICGGWYPLELNAEESARTFVGQNSTQKPHALHRST